MISQNKREELVNTIRAFQSTPDFPKTTVQQAYDKLYPDNVDFGMFTHVWHHALNNPVEAVSKTPAEALRTETGPESVEVKSAVTTNDAPSSSMTQVDADSAPPASVLEASPADTGK